MRRVLIVLGGRGVNAEMPTVSWQLCDNPPRTDVDVVVDVVVVVVVVVDDGDVNVNLRRSPLTPQLAFAADTERHVVISAT